MYMLAYTEEARACLQEMPKERRQDCVAALIRLAADPYAQPSTPVVRGKEETNRMVPIADRVMAHYAVDDRGLLLVTVIDIYDGTV